MREPLWQKLEFESMREPYCVVPCIVCVLCAQIFAANISACRQLRSSRCFKQALSLALVAGNYLNHGTSKGNAVGFK